MARERKAPRQAVEKFSQYDTADYLKSEQDMAAYLEVAMEEAGDDATFLATALGKIARARGMNYD